jgi:amino acid adenylation domain-containing protein
LGTDEGIGLHGGFLRAVGEHPSQPALEVDGTAVSFADVKEAAASVAATITELAAVGAPGLTAVLGRRSLTAYTGVLGALLAGHGYVPLNPAFPAERTRSMLLRAGASVMVVDAPSLPLLAEVLDGLPTPISVVVPELPEVDAFAESWPAHRFVGSRQMAPPKAWVPSASDPEAVAYLLFTSGSTGEPKGVAVTHANVVPFVEAMADRYGITSDDRFSQTFDLTFDLSVFDLFVAWARGACVCVPSAKALMAPREYVTRSALTVWFSVPSLAVLMRRLGMLKPDRYPTLRWSLFCGEALPMEIAAAWAAAAPGSTVENLYGPTEATIACTAYRWVPDRSPAECEQGLVPIGWPLAGMTALVAGDELTEVSPGAAGELLMAGPQVTPGYWNDSGRTAAAFVVPPGRRERYYRTGDRVRRPVGDEPLRYLGRLDNQVKVHGHRVELGEVEAVVREEAEVSGVAAIGWPETESGVAGVVAFLEDPEVDLETLRKRVSTRLPPYMVPRRFHVLGALPRNSNGKVDRHALRRHLESTA